MGRGVGQGLLNFGQFPRSLPSPVEAGLLAKAAGQSLYASQTNRFREQARSHRGCVQVIVNCEGATPSSRRNMSLKLLGEYPSSRAITLTGTP